MGVGEWGAAVRGAATGTCPKAQQAVFEVRHYGNKEGEVKIKCGGRREVQQAKEAEICDEMGRR